MGDPESRIYDVVNPIHPPWSPANQKASNLKRSKTIAPSHPSRMGGHSGYAVPRSIPPAVPPRNRHPSEGLQESPPMSFLSSSPSDRGLFTNSLGRGRTGSVPSSGSMSKSPSVLSVSSAHSVVEELALPEFVSKYSKNLPLRVRVCKGLFGITEETAVTAGDIFNLHFMKTTKVVTAEVGVVPGVELSIPVSSTIKFGLLYNQNEKLEEPRRGFTFETVADIVAMKTLPKVVCAKRAFTGSSSESSVSENELLIIKSTKGKLKGKQLRVFSLTFNKKKTLGENCAGNFTTNPADTQLHLFEMTVHFQDVFPCKAVIFLPVDVSDGVLSDLSGSTVTLKQCVTESSVIATAGVCEDGEIQSEVAELPAELDIEVEAVALDDQEIDTLRHDTRYMYELFDPHSVCLYMNKPTKRIYDLQCMLYKTIMADGLRGLEAVRPTAIQRPVSAAHSASTTPTHYNVPLSHSAPTASSTHLPPPPPPPSNNPTGRPTYEPLNPGTRDKFCTDYYVLMNPPEQSVSLEQAESSDYSGSASSQSSGHLSLLEVHNRSIEKTLKDTQEQLTRVLQDVSRLTATTDHLKKWCGSLQTKIRMMEADRAGIDSRPPAPLPEDRTYHAIQHGRTVVSRSESRSPTPPAQLASSSTDVDESKYLGSLTQSQVQKLLEAMGLKQYLGNFKEEQVNGEILSECDEEVLQNDLGVASKLHRMRLLKVISGRHSARYILAGDDPYAHRRKASGSSC